MTLKHPKMRRPWDIPSIYAMDHKALLIKRNMIREKKFFINLANDEWDLLSSL